MKSQILFLLTCVLLLGCKTEKQKSGVPQFQKKIDAFIYQLEVDDEAMGGISIFQNGKETYQKNWGLSQIEQRKKPDKQTKYRIGSITKTFTATIILQLIEEGKLSFDTQLSDFYPDISNSNEMTIGQLLKHRSGLFNLTDWEKFDSIRTVPQPEINLIEIFKSFQPVFNPNQRTEYSNTNYILLSMIAENIESKSFQKILEDRIINPLRLHNTTYGREINPSQNEAYSYSKQENKWVKSQNTDLSIPRGAGGISSTPTDLNFFYINLFDKKLLNETSLAKMTEIQEGWGMGLSRLPHPTKVAYGHPGGIDGFSSLSVYFPDEALSISYTSNGQNISTQQVIFPILEMYFTTETSNNTAK